MSTPYCRLKKHCQLRRFAVPSYNFSDTDPANLNAEDVNLEVDNFEHFSTQTPSTSDQIFENINSSSNFYADINTANNDFSSNLSIPSLDNTYRSPDFGSYDCDSPQYFLSLISSSDESSQEVNNVLNFCQKLHGWAVRFRQNLTIETIDLLLDILKSENIPNLP